MCSPRCVLLFFHFFISSTCFSFFFLTCLYAVRYWPLPMISLSLSLPLFCHFLLIYCRLLNKEVVFSNILCPFFLPLLNLYSSFSTFNPFFIAELLIYQGFVLFCHHWVWFHNVFNDWKALMCKDSMLHKLLSSFTKNKLEHCKHWAKYPVSDLESSKSVPSRMKTKYAFMPLCHFCFFSFFFHSFF